MSLPSSPFMGLLSSPFSIFDPLVKDAARIVVENGEAKVSLLQEKLGIDYFRALSIMNQLYLMMIVEKDSSLGYKDVLVKKEKIDSYLEILDSGLSAEKIK